MHTFRGLEWVTEEIELVRSRLGKGPGRRSAHETLHSWPLVTERIEAVYRQALGQHGHAVATEQATA